jgi:hypothetical protein
LSRSPAIAWEVQVAYLGSGSGGNGTLLFQVKPGSVENGIFSGLDWLPTLADAAGNPDITTELLTGVKLGDWTYKNQKPPRRL